MPKRYVYATVFSILFITVGITILSVFEKYFPGINALSTDGLACFLGGTIPSIISLTILFINRLDNQEAQSEADKKHEELILLQLKQERRSLVYNLSKEMSDYFSQISYYNAKFMNRKTPDNECSERLIKLSNMFCLHLQLLTGTEEMILILNNIKVTIIKFEKNIKLYKKFNVKQSEIEQFTRDIKRFEKDLEGEFVIFTKEYIENVLNDKG